MLIFVNFECGNFVVVYKDIGGVLEFVQLLLIYVGLEGLLVILQWDLFVVVNEVDEDGVCFYVMLYKFGVDVFVYLLVVFVMDLEKNVLIGWGVLFVFVVDLVDFNMFYMVSDSFYDEVCIYILNILIILVMIVFYKIVMGFNQFKFDLEGILVVKDGGFWLVFEGYLENDWCYLFLKVDLSGVVQEEILLL